ncbi:MAG: hypothetical protein WBA28_04900 [Microbacteriaceae bacterium]
MNTKLIPEATKTAAKRGFIRTASQSLATGFGVAGGLTLVFTQDGMLALAVGAAGMAATALLNGAQSFFSILAQGIPEDYTADSSNQ